MKFKYILAALAGLGFGMCAKAAHAQTRTFKTDVSGDSVTDQMRTYWRDRMTYLAKKQASCVTGHWREEDSTFIIDALTEPRKNCRMERTAYQGMLAYLEVDAWDTYESMKANWQLIMDDYPEMMFLGAVVALTPNRRPVLWGIQRHVQPLPSPAKPS